MQCAAFFLKDTRCGGDVVGDSHHCEYHREKAKRLYLKYKKLDQKYEYLENNPCVLDDVGSKIDYYIKLYDIYHKAYLAREKHRKYAFVPECYDEGHDYQFTKLNRNMDDCGKTLVGLFKLAEEKETSNIIEESKGQIVPDDCGIRINRSNINLYRKLREKTKEGCN